MEESANKTQRAQPESSNVPPANAAARVLLTSEWSVIETGLGTLREKSKREGSKPSSKSREKICSFDNMKDFVAFFTTYPKPGNFFQSHDAARYVHREDQDVVVQVKDLVVIRSHISAEFEDPAFCDSNGKCIGHIMRINRINTAAEFNAIWDALLIRVVGETLLPRTDFPEQLVACLRAKDMTNKKKKKNNLVPNYRIELWLCNGADYQATIEDRVRNLVDQVCKDSQAQKLMVFEFKPMLAGSWKGADSRGSTGGKQSFWRK